MVPDGPYMFPYGPHMVHNGPHMVPYAPHMVPDCPSMVADGPHVVPDDLARSCQSDSGHLQFCTNLPPNSLLTSLRCACVAACWEIEDAGAAVAMRVVWGLRTAALQLRLRMRCDCSWFLRGDATHAQMQLQRMRKGTHAQCKRNATQRTWVRKRP